MTAETIREIEDRWTVMMAARYGAGHPQAGQRIYEMDGKYAREVTALGVEISERKKAESSRPQINQDQLAWLDRVQAAADQNGRRPAQEMSAKGTTIRKNLENARRDVLEGKSLAQSLIENTERTLAEQGVAMPATMPRPTQQHRDRDGNLTGDARLAPPALDLTVALSQPINTGRGPQV